VNEQTPILVIGYGNPGRQDDGLGPSLVHRLADVAIPGVTAGAQYQLNAEDALRISAYQQVVFVDAATNMRSDFRFAPLRRSRRKGFGSHRLAPEAVLDLASTLYGKEPRGYLLGIRGERFDEFEEKLSPVGEQNLEKALEFLVPWLKHRVTVMRGLRNMVRAVVRRG